MMTKARGSNMTNRKDEAAVCYICGTRKDGVRIDVSVTGYYELTRWAVIILCPMCVDLQNIQVKSNV